MNEHEFPPQEPEAPAPVDPATPVKPRRRRAAPKPQAEAGAGAPEAGVLPVQPELAPAAEAKPARARRPRKAQVEDGAPQAVTPAPVSASADAPEVPPAPPAPPVDAAQSAPLVADAQAQPAAPGAPEATVGEGPDESDGPPGSTAVRDGGRRRRRRSKRERSERAAQAEATAPGEAGAAPAHAEAVPVVATDPGELFAELLSGDFDARTAGEEAGQPTEEAPRRVLAPEPDAPKLQKVLAQAGIGSRRDMEQWMQEGRVTVNGRPAHTGQRVSFGDRVAIDGKPVRLRIAPPPPRVLAYHKPVGEVVTHDDPQHRPTVFRRLPRLAHGKWQSVGRLDINTEGLLLFTNSGELANQLMHPRFGVEREYAVRSLGVLDEDQRRQLLEGIDIEGQRASFVSVEDGGGEGVNHWYRVVITEGRNREVRRLFEAVGHAVSRLIRIRYGCVVLPRGLKRGVWVDLPEPDVRALRQLTGTARAGGGGEAAAAGEGGGRNKRGRRGNRQRDDRRELPRDRGGERGPRPDRSVRSDADDDGPMHIPNPLQQTYDKRFIQQARRPQREYSEDGPIPNPLQQTYDKRGLQRERPLRDLPEDGPIPNPLQQTYDKRFVQKGGGGGGGRGPRGAAGAGGMRQPDPMQTAMGYLGADALRGRGGKGGGKGGGKAGKRRGSKRGGGGGTGGPMGGARGR